MRWRRILGAWGPVAVWMGVIFFVSAQTRLPRFVLPGVLLPTDKALHLLEYAVLGALCYRAVVRTFPAGFPMGWSFTIGVMYAATDEFHQRFVPGRQSDWADLAADAGGVLLGLIAAHVVLRFSHALRQELRRAE